MVAVYGLSNYTSGSVNLDDRVCYERVKDSNTGGGSSPTSHSIGCSGNDIDLYYIIYYLKLVGKDDANVGDEPQEKTFSHLVFNQPISSGFTLSSDLENIQYSLFSNTVNRNENLCLAAGGAWDSELNECCGDASSDGGITGWKLCEQSEEGWSWNLLSGRDYCAQTVGSEDYEDEFHIFQDFDDTTITSYDIYNTNTGGDSCCGDDSDVYCHPLYTSCDEVPAGSCADYGCESTGQASGSFSCSAFYSYTGEDKQGGYCPSSCTENQICILDGSEVDKPCPDATVDNCPGGCHWKTTSCSGTYSCAEDGYYDGWCQWTYGSPACTGDIDEAVDDCHTLSGDECGENNLCTWTDPKDSDHSYVSPDQDFFCNKDYSDVEGYNAGVTYGDDGAWKWWEAVGQNNAYRIHAGFDRDFISNNEHWYACNADDGYEGNAQTTSDLGSLPLSTFETDMQSLCNPASDLSSYNEEELEGWSNYVFDDKTRCEDLSVLENEDALQRELLAYVEEYRDSLSDDLKDKLASGFVGCCYHIDDSAPSDSEGKKYDYRDFLEPGGAVSCEQFECVTLRETQDDNGLLGQGGLSDDNPRKDAEYAQDYTLESDILTCAELGVEEGEPSETCEEGTCVPLDPELGFPVNAEDGLCCFGGYCEEDPQTRPCEDLGGSRQATLFPPGSDDYVCHGWEVESSEAGTCCIGPWDLSDDVDVDLERDRPFICYQGADGRSMYAECCSESRCTNIPSWSTLNSALGEDNGRVYGTGTQLHTVLSYDEANYSGDGNLSDHIKRVIIKAAQAGSEVSVKLGDVHPVMRGAWQGGDRLALDIKYAGTYKPTTLVLYNESDEISRYILQDHLVLDNLIPNHWHHVEVTLDGASSEATRLRLLAENVTPAGTNTPDTTILVDNVVLKPQTQGEPYYCSGPYGEWLSDLKVDQTDDEDGDGLDLDDTASEQVACNAQLSAGWTGTSCCGRTYDGKADVTPVNTDFTQGEYYLDTEAACWGGVPVRDDTTVKRAYGNNPGYWSHLLYKEVDRSDGQERKVWSCGPESFDDTNQGVDEEDDGSLNITRTGGSSYAENVIVENVDYFSIIGHWYCDPVDGQEAGRWRPLRDIARVKALASKLYGMAGDDYTLHCDYYDLEEVLQNSSSLSTLGTSLGDPSGEAVHACALRNETADGQHVYLAIPLARGTDSNAFIKSLYQTYQPLNNSHTMPDCSMTPDGDMPEDVIIQGGSSEEFFSPCLGTGSEGAGGLHASYNKPLDLLLLSLDEPPTRSFFATIWQAVKGFFTDMFLGAGEGPSDAGPTTLPLQSIQGDYTHLYLAENGTKRIRGLMEHGAIHGSWYVRVDYENFRSSVEPLLEGYRALGLTPDEAKRCGTGHNQTIFLQFRDDDAKGFDWRYLTSNIRLNADGDLGTFSSDSECWLHNGKVDHPTEECDDDAAHPREMIDTRDSLPTDHFTCEDGSWKQCVNGKVDDTNCGSLDYILFATEERYNGALGGLFGADDKCVQAASDGGFVHADNAFAVLSTSTRDAAQRMPAEGVVYDNAGHQLTDFPGGLFAGTGFSHTDPFFYDQHGDLIDTDTYHDRVWSGTYRLGTYSSNRACNDWTSSSNDRTGRYGAPGAYASNGKWIDAASVFSCDEPYHLWCMVPIASS